MPKGEVNVNEALGAGQVGCTAVADGTGGMDNAGVMETEVLSNDTHPLVSVTVN